MYHQDDEIIDGMCPWVQGDDRKEKMFNIFKKLYEDSKSNVGVFATQTSGTSNNEKGDNFEAVLLPRITWTTDRNHRSALRLQLMLENVQKENVNKMKSFDCESVENPNSVSKKIVHFLHNDIKKWYPHRAVKLTKMFLERHDEEEVIRYLRRPDRLRNKLGLFDRLLDTEDKAKGVVAEPDKYLSSLIDSEFTTYYECKSTHFPLQSDSTWTVHQGFTIDIEGCCGASCFACEVAIYRSYGDCILYCRGREFFQTGCGAEEGDSSEEEEPTVSLHVFIGLLLTPKLIAQRVIGSSDGVWDEISKVIYQYCPLAIFSEIDQEKVKEKKNEWTKALERVPQESFSDEEDGFPDCATWDSILSFRRDYRNT